MKWLMAAMLLAASTVQATIAQASTVLIAESPNWEYTFVDPTGDPSWNAATGVGGNWFVGSAPFGNYANHSDYAFAYNTYWPATYESGVPAGDDLWARHSINLTGLDLTLITWVLGVDNGFKLYANGNFVSAANKEGVAHRWDFSGSFPSTFLHDGINVIAVALEDHGDGPANLTAFDMEVHGPGGSTPPPSGNVPEPTTLALVAAALLGITGTRRREPRTISTC